MTSEASQIIIAIIASQIGATALMLTAMSIIWKATNQRFKDTHEIVDAKFKTVDARFETLTVQIHADMEALRREIRELDRTPPIWKANR